MANYNCAACEELRAEDPNLIINGLGTDECLNLKNNLGLVANDGKGTEADLNRLNDCLIGNMSAEIDSYQNCDWKVFMKQLIPNIWTNIKALICTVSGLWTMQSRIDCLVDFVINGKSFTFNEKPKVGESSYIYLNPNSGVDFSIRRQSEEHTYDVTLLYVAGGLARLYGSLRLFTTSFKDADGNTRAGNSVWSMNSAMPRGGERLFEIRLRKSEYPQIKRFFDGDAFSSAGNDLFYQCYIKFFDEGAWAYGQHGWCKSDGSAYTSADAGYDNTYSAGHQVPSGWMYVQLRLGYKGTLSTYTVKDGDGNDKTGLNLTPAGYLGVRMNQDGIEC